MQTYSIEVVEAKNLNVHGYRGKTGMGLNTVCLTTYKIENVGRLDNICRKKPCREDRERDG